MNIRTFVAKSAIKFSENEGVGSKTVLNFSENSSVLVGLPVSLSYRLEVLPGASVELSLTFWLPLAEVDEILFLNLIYFGKCLLCDPTDMC